MTLTVRRISSRGGIVQLVSLVEQRVAKMAFTNAVPGARASNTTLWRWPSSESEMVRRTDVGSTWRGSHAPGGPPNAPADLSKVAVKVAPTWRHTEAVLFGDNSTDTDPCSQFAVEVLPGGEVLEEGLLVTTTELVVTRVESVVGDVLAAGPAEDEPQELRATRAISSPSITEVRRPVSQPRTIFSSGSSPDDQAWRG